MSTFSCFCSWLGGDTIEHSQNRFVLKPLDLQCQNLDKKKGPKDRSKGPNLFLPFLLSLLNRD